MSIEELQEEALKLDEADRADLADCILDSLEGADPNDADLDSLTEAKMRSEEVDSGKVELVEKDAFFQEIRASRRK